LIKKMEGDGKDGNPGTTAPSVVTAINKVAWNLFNL
jgi:hypothetical protein